MIEIKIDTIRFKKARMMINRYNLQQNKSAERKLYNRVRYAIIKAWKESVDAAKITTRTGKLKNDISFCKRGWYKYTFTANAPHAKFLYYGTAPSRGRYIKKIGKRLRKDRLVYHAKKRGWHWVGWHPGIKTTKYPLRTRFTQFRREYINKAIERWLRVISR